MDVRCSYCGKAFGPGKNWHGANFCRAAFLLPHIEANPGKTTWELHQISGLPYADATKGLEKAREWDVVEFDAEDRESGGQRYRYRVAPGYQIKVQEWLARALI